MPEVDATTLEFVAWVARIQRTYAEAMSAWRSSCPRLTTWEDALAAGLVRIDGPAGGPIDAAPVLLTSRGQMVLDGRGDRRVVQPTGRAIRGRS